MFSSLCQSHCDLNCGLSLKIAGHGLDSIWTRRRLSRRIPFPSQSPGSQAPQGPSLTRSAELSCVTVFMTVTPSATGRPVLALGAAVLPRPPSSVGCESLAALQTCPFLRSSGLTGFWFSGLWGVIDSNHRYRRYYLHLREKGLDSPSWRDAKQGSPTVDRHATKNADSSY